MNVPSLQEALRSAEKKLGVSLNGNVKVSTHNHLDEKLLEILLAIDHAKFHGSLWYNSEELRSRAGKPGFFCLLVSLNGEPIAFDFGYDDQEEEVYFSDSSATKIERKGVGTVLAVLEIIYLYENGYSALKFTTEEMDQASRPLRQIWEKMGYRTVSSDPVTGVTMMLDITKQAIYERIKKHLDM